METRRSALQLLAAGILSACSEQKFQEAPVRKLTGAGSYRVFIIGAGMSGAKAACDLSNAGFDVTVLEARDRIGGRIWTDRSMGVPIDLGASWIHGIRGNPVHSLAQRLTVPLYEWDYTNAQYFNQDNDNQRAFLLKYLELSYRLWSVGETVLDQNPSATVQDVVDALEKDGSFGKLSKKEIELLITLLIEQSAAADAEELSLAGLLADEEFGGPDVVFPQGYDALPRALLEGIDVRLNERVTAVDYTNDTIKITTAENTHTADFIIATVPLGVLKAGDIAFSPALPDEKQNAIDRLKMGVLNKIYLRFANVFWDNDRHMMIRNADVIEGWPTWFNLAEVTDKPVLVALNGGSFGRSLEKLSDPEIVQQAMTALRSMYGDDIPEPEAFHITRWARDPMAYGSYSFVPAGATPEMRGLIRSPVANRIFFAGEATSSDHPSTVHGAYLTGRRAASEIMERI